MSDIHLRAVFYSHDSSSHHVVKVCSVDVELVIRYYLYRLFLPLRQRKKNRGGFERCLIKTTKQNNDNNILYKL